MNMIGVCPAQLNCNFWEVILVCETLNERWAASGSERRTSVKDFLDYYAVKYVTATDGAYLSSSSSRPCFFDLSSAGRVWNDNLLWVSGINCKVSRKESFIDTVAREGTELDAVLKELEISRFKRVASKDDKVRRSQAKRRMAGKAPGSMEEKLSTPKLNTPLKLTWFNEMPDGPVDMTNVSSTVVRNMAKRKAIKRRAASRSVTSDSVDDSSKRRKVTSPIKSQVVLEENVKIAEGADLRLRFEFARALRGVQLCFQDRSIELGKRISLPEEEKNQFQGNLTWEREAFQLELEKEREAAALKLKEVRAESTAEAERLVTASATSRNNLAWKLYQLRYTKAEIMAFSEGNYEEKEIMDEEEVEEMEDGLNVVEKTAANDQETIDQEIESSRLGGLDLEGLLEVEKKSFAELQKELDVAREREEQTLLYNAEYAEEYKALISQDLALNQLTSELAELKEKAVSGSRREAELAEYRIRTLNDEISDMKLDRLKTNLYRFKGREAQSRADLAEIQANSKSLVDNLAHARRNRELRVHEMKYQKDLKFELDKRDGEIAFCEGSREMKEFLHRKEELVENMSIDLTNSWQKSIDLTRQISESIDQLTAELAESKARRLEDNKRAAVTHQAFKELVVHEPEN
ncbi:hypothetical protein GIB67_018557, partial [Kingdonia uniflora]